MAQYKITIGGSAYALNMPDDASQADIAAAADDYAKHIQGSAAGSAPTHSQAAPAPAPAEPDTSYGGALMHGLHGAAHGIGSTMKVAGDATGQQSLSDAGTRVEGAIGDAPGYQPTDIAGALRKGDYRGAVGQLPRAAVEAGTDLAGGLGAAALGGVVGGPVGAAAGAAAYTGARNFGENAEAAAAANHNAPTDNLTRAGLVTAGQAALSTVGLGKAPGVAQAVESIPSALGRSAARVGLDAAGAAGADAVGQVGNTAGTTDGVKYDPYQSVAAGAQGAVARAAGETVPLVRAGGKELTERAMAAGLDKPVTLDQARAWAQVRDDYLATKSRAEAAKGDTSPLAIMNSVKSEYAETAAGLVRRMRDVGVVEPEQARNLQELFEQARRHNNTPTENGEGVTTLFDRIKELPLPPEAQTTLQQLARAMDTASSESFAKNQTGPFRQLGTIAGNVAGIAGGLAAHNPWAVAGAAMDTALGRGHGIAGRVGGAIGGLGDSFFDTNNPQLLLKARSADKMLRKAGEETGGSPLEAAQTMRSALDEIAPAVQKVKARRTLDEINSKIRGDFEDTSEKDAAWLDKQRQQDETTQARTRADAHAAWERQQASLKDASDASMAAQAKAQAEIDKQRNSTLDAFDAGKPLPGLTDGVDAPPVGKPMTLAEEMRINDQRVRNLANAASLRQKQRAVLAKAQAGDLDVQAQAKADKAGKANEVQLRAAEATPGYPGTSETAATAAAAQQALAADRVRRLADANHEMADRIAVGSPPSDPAQADGLSPVVRQAPSGARQAAPAAAPVQPPQAAPEAAPAAPQGPAFDGFAAKPTAHRWVERGIGSEVHPEHFARALQSLVDEGVYTPEQAAHLGSHAGGIENLAAAAEPLKAKLRKAAIGIPMDPLPGEKGEPRSPTQWASGERNYVRLADGLIQDAKDAGHENLVTVLRQIKAEPFASKKAAIAADALKRLPDGERQAGERVLTGKLLEGRDDMPGQTAPAPASASPPAKPAPKRSSPSVVEVAERKAKVTAALKAHVEAKSAPAPEPTKPEPAPTPALDKEMDPKNMTVYGALLVSQYHGHAEDTATPQQKVVAKALLQKLVAKGGRNTQARNERALKRLGDIPDKE